MSKSVIAIAGIHTGIGKTIAAAVITEALQAHYWKPVQAGTEERDMKTVAGLITDGETRVCPEAVLLQMPASPHKAAAAEGIEIDHAKFKWPDVAGTLVLETAGGLHSPISATATMADFLAHYQLPVLLITQHYLGSINHTLLTIETLRNRGIHIAGLIVNGNADKSSESFIEQYAAIPILAHIPHFPTLSRDAVQVCAANIRPALVAAVSTL
jgi:dethiobiotin synthetase